MVILKTDRVCLQKFKLTRKISKWPKLFLMQKDRCELCIYLLHAASTIPRAFSHLKRQAGFWLTFTQEMERPVLIFL